MEELTVKENIDLFCSFYIEDAKLRKKYVDKAMDFVEISRFEKYLPKKLSGDLKRRLNIACGIAHKPDLIFFDEPTVAVDPQSRNNILESIKKLNELGSTYATKESVDEQLKMVNNFYRLIAYPLMALVMNSVYLGLKNYNKSNIKNRIKVSGVGKKRYTIQLFLAALTSVVGLWFLINIIPILLFDVEKTKLLLYSLNILYLCYQ